MEYPLLLYPPVWLIRMKTVLRVVHVPIVCGRETEDISFATLANPRGGY